MPITILGLFIVAVAVQFFVSLSFYPTLAWTRARRRPLALLAIALIALTPLSIPATARFPRFLSAVIAIALMVKLYDLHRTCGPSLRPTLGAYVAYLPNWLSVVWRKLAATPCPTRRESTRRLGIALLQAAAAGALFVWMLRLDWEFRPFLVEHSIKVFSLFLVLIPVTHAYTALWRLCGGRGLDPMDRPLLAVTPADFWRRYNRPAQQFFHDHVYRCIRRSPLRAVVITFVVSALIHEYVFDISVSRVQGYQTIFFLLQGAAVAATIRFRPAGHWVWPAIAATFFFNLTSSIFFFASVQGVVPFYANGLPAWLSW
jgi:hypothetical protein